ncbi:GIY-YIG nuclease family protein [Synechococcus sp. RSCCF101]|nr:GIY-YIG nuclease family protein [Synechococcus sp. RSCCF101]
MFPAGDGEPPAAPAAEATELRISRAQLSAWLQRIADHQQPLLQKQPAPGRQMDLLGSASGATSIEQHAEELAPLALAPRHLQFWRWPSPDLSGAAIYLVMDQPAGLASPLLLYVGETGRADQRWKGDHDCKAYLSAYREALVRAGLESQPTIRFWSDVPSGSAARRRLEQALIQRWQPPFNKETRSRWATPFHAGPA